MASDELMRDKGVDLCLSSDLKEPDHKLQLDNC